MRSRFSSAALIWDVSPEVLAATAWIQALFRRNHTAPAQAAANNRPPSFHPPSAAKKFLWPIARCVIKPADRDRKARDIRRWPVLKLPTAAPVAQPWS